MMTKSDILQELRDMGIDISTLRLVWSSTPVVGVCQLTVDYGELCESRGRKLDGSPVSIDVGLEIALGPLSEIIKEYRLHKI